VEVELAVVAWLPGRDPRGVVLDELAVLKRPAGEVDVPQEATRREGIGAEEEALARVPAAEGLVGADEGQGVSRREGRAGHGQADLDLVAELAARDRVRPGGIDAERAVLA
tara:strand:+ start:256 stop:588 length:333 start_codon:yes stop_codon:yes gene_type:complete